MSYKIIELLVKGGERDVGKTCENISIKDVFVHYGFDKSSYLSYFTIESGSNGEYYIRYLLNNALTYKLVPIKS